MSPKLELNQSNYGYYAAWYDDGEEWARVGEGLKCVDGKYELPFDPKTHEDPEYAAVEAAAAAFANENPDHVISRRDSICHELLIESKSKAISYLLRLKLAMKLVNANKPWPDWAIKATEAGWKPPRGWKP